MLAIWKKSQPLFKPAKLCLRQRSEAVNSGHCGSIKLMESKIISFVREGPGMPNKCGIVIHN